LFGLALTIESSGNATIQDCDPALSEDNPNSSTQRAGATFMGQCMDHDMTFDLTSRLGVPADPKDSPNSRTPGLDLESLYGGGPLANPDLYVRPGGRRSHDHPTRFKIESGDLFEDVPRDRHGTAIIADPRNDKNLIISGLQAAFLSFHNHAVEASTTTQWTSWPATTVTKRVTRCSAGHAGSPHGTAGFWLAGSGSGRRRGGA
jgi:hypothetical protein